MDVCDIRIDENLQCSRAFKFSRLRLKKGLIGEVGLMSSSSLTKDRLLVDA